jgi:hypothetical protein
MTIERKLANIDVEAEVVDPKGFIPDGNFNPEEEIQLSDYDKQETLEEAAENNYCFESDIEMVNFISEMASTGKIPNRWSAFVAKINELYLFKQEQDKNNFSEEDMKSSFQVGFNVGYNDEESPSYLTFEEWIKEYKNK